MGSRDIGLGSGSWDMGLGSGLWDIGNRIEFLRYRFWVWVKISRIPTHIWAFYNLVPKIYGPYGPCMDFLPKICGPFDPHILLSFFQKWTD